MTMKYFDAHCHIQFSSFDEDRDAVLARMKDTELGALIVGTDRTSSAQAVLLADGKTLFASVGLHPNDKPGEGYDDAYYETLAQDPKVVAIGECGLDYFRPDDPESEKKRQVPVFEKHIELAGKTGKPLMIHARPSKGTMDAYNDAYDMIISAQKKYPNLSGNMHFFVGDSATAKKFTDIGFTLSYTAVLTFTKEYDDVVRSVPLSSLLSETDAPYVAPAHNRGKRNEPTAAIDVVHAIARIRGEDEEAVRKTMLASAKRAFSLP